MQYVAQKQATDRADRQAGRMEDRADQSTAELMTLGRENARQYDPATRQANRQAAEERAVESLSAALEAGRGRLAGQPGQEAEGRVSDAYLTQRAQRTLAEANLATDIARRMAKVRAPGDLRFREGLENADYGARMGRVASDRGNMYRAGQVDVERAARPNPLLMMLGAGLSGYGQGKALAGGGGDGSVTPMAVRGARAGAAIGRPAVPVSFFR